MKICYNINNCWKYIGRSLERVNKYIMKNFRKLNKFGFTLTEVLLAVVIVGIIAALVLPAVITEAQDKVFDYKEERQLQAIKSVVDQLKVTEGVSLFKNTMMYSPLAVYSADDTAGKFLKKYFRIAKYCGAPKGDGSSECFADTYYSYPAEGGVKKEIPVKDLDLKGACAQLKNGTSICITPQLIGNNPISVVMDLNGPKGPNVAGRDLIEVQTLPLVDIGGETVDRATDNTILAEDNDVIIPDRDDQCSSTGDFSDTCCSYRLSEGLIKDADDPCCGNVNLAGAISVCYKEADIHVDYYPTGGSLPGSLVLSGTTPYVKSSSNTKIVPGSLRIPDGLTIRVKCGNGTLSSATLQSSTLQQAIDASPSSKTFYFSGKVYNTSCYYNKEILIWDGANTSDGGKTITYKGLIYHLYQH